MQVWPNGIGKLAGCICWHLSHSYDLLAEEAQLAEGTRCVQVQSIAAILKRLETSLEDLGEGDGQPWQDLRDYYSERSFPGAVFP